MCNIAGYAGKKQAAPILIDMIRRQENYDGSGGTGIATVHNGILYSAKVVGDVETLLRETDALNFPGTIGIAHSRPGGNIQCQMHPFLDFDETLALVANGTFATTDTDEYKEISRRIMHGHFAEGRIARSAIPGNDPDALFALPDGSTYHGTESYAIRVGDFMKEGASICEAMAKAFTERPNGIVSIALSKNEPDTIAIAKMDRPMSVGLIGDETYIATTQFGFPEDIRFDTIVRTPECTVCAAKAGELTVTRHRIGNMHMEAITADIYKKAYDLTEAYLKGQKDSPKNLWDLEKMYETEWKHIWKEINSDCVFYKEDRLFKPYAELSYMVLWGMHTEGKLRKVMRKRAEKYDMWYFYLD